MRPWLMCRLSAETDDGARLDAEAEWLPVTSAGTEQDLAQHHEGRLGRLYRAVAAPIL